MKRIASSNLKVSVLNIISFQVSYARLGLSIYKFVIIVYHWTGDINMLFKNCIFHSFERNYLK